MEPVEALSTAAQLALALAGFAGVVVVFRSSAVHEWAPMDKLRLRLLLSNSVFPLALCLLAMWLLSVKPPPEWIWRGCSGLSVAFFFPFGVFTAKAMRAVPRDDLRMGGSFKLVFYPVGMLGAAVIVLQIYNLIVLNAFWAFFALIVFQLLAGTFQFVRLIILAS